MDTVERIIGYLYSIRETEPETDEPLEPEADDSPGCYLRRLYQEKDKMLDEARAKLARIPEDQRPYAIGRARQRVYDNEGIATSDNDLIEMLGISGGKPCQPNHSTNSDGGPTLYWDFMGQCWSTWSHIM